MPNMANSNGGTVLTVPANRVWSGRVALSATAASATGDGATTTYPSVTITGTGADDWSNGDTVVGCALVAPAINVAALTGQAVTATANSGNIVIRARANSISLTLNLGTRVVGMAVATGEFL